jgi:hypothetical protein
MPDDGPMSTPHRLRWSQIVGQTYLISSSATRGHASMVSRCLARSGCFRTVCSLDPGRVSALSWWLCLVPAVGHRLRHQLCLVPCQENGGEIDIHTVPCTTVTTTVTFMCAGWGVFLAWVWWWGGVRRFVVGCRGW